METSRCPIHTARNCRPVSAVKHRSAGPEKRDFISEEKQPGRSLWETVQELGHTLEVLQINIKNQ